jgi:TolA-binding protein
MTVIRSLFLAAVAAAALAAPAAAQTALEGRVGKLESEMRAVQRKVFPGGAGQYLQPEIVPERAPVEGPGAPASSPVADLSQRVAALEGQLSTLTGQVEQAQYRLRQLEDQFAAYRKATDARLAQPVAAAPDAGDEPRPAPRDRAPAGDALPAAGRTTSARPAGPAAATRDPARAERVAAVAKPASGDAAEDAYLYGYRLWEAKLYPEAEAQLKDVVATYPKSKRASYAQNLLGRAYLDEGKPSLASIAFYDNYKKFPDGERAPDSLYYLAQALMKLNKPADACKVYGELTDVYGAKIAPGMRDRVAKGRADAKCK